MIGIIIPYYKNSEDLKKCLTHLEDQNISYDLFIRDNSDDNILFTKAVNEGLRNFYSEKYVLILNQDCYLEKDCIKNMIEFMDNNTKCGICCPVAKDSLGYVTFGGGKGSFPNGEHIHEILSDKPYKTHWINGACMFVRTEMLREIGILDENMKFICSDSDISFTARARGWDLYVISNAFAIHELHGSVSTDDELLQVKKEDIYYFYKKWYSSELFKNLDYNHNQSL